MIAKSIASETEVTTILISAEMIQQRNDIKSAFRLARKLAPTLIIIEDIDTAGTVSRRFADHPILGEYLQAMDGIEANEGVVVLATTNHTENIDPAISDRPGRFDRIIDVPLPDAEQRINILANLLAKMPTDNLTFGLGTKDAILATKRLPRLDEMRSTCRVRGFVKLSTQHSFLQHTMAEIPSVLRI